MTWNRKRFDSVWWIAIASGVAAVCLDDHPLPHLPYLAPIVLAVSIVIAGFLAMFVTREDDVDKVAEGAISADEAISLAIDKRQLRDPNPSASTAYFDTVKNQCTTESDVRHSERGGTPARNLIDVEPVHAYYRIYQKQQVLSLTLDTTRMMLEQLAIEQHRAKRRDIFAEAVQIAKLLPGLGLEVAITPENHIVLRECQAKGEVVSGPPAPEQGASTGSKQVTPLVH